MSLIWYDPAIKVILSLKYDLALVKVGHPLVGEGHTKCPYYWGHTLYPVSILASKIQKICAPPIALTLKK